MKVDFRRNVPATAPILISGEAVETVNAYKYLGTILDDKRTFDENTDSICKKANQRLFFLRSFNVDRSILKMFYWNDLLVR